MIGGLKMTMLMMFQESYFDNKRMVATRYSVRVFVGLLASMREFWYSKVIRRHVSGATS